MRRTTLLATFAAILIVMAMGAGAAQAYWGWYWNAEINLEGTSLRTAWTVVDGDESDYFTDIRVSVPRKADADVVEFAEGHERVKISSGRRLSCDADSVDAIVTFKVKADDKRVDRKGRVEVEITADGQVIGTADGRVGKKISVRVEVPANDPDCWEGDDDQDEVDDDDDDEHRDD